MITRGCYIFTLLFSYVLSVPVPSDQVEKDEIKVMKCIVEVIADTLNKPHPIPISQECQDSLTGDDRIVSILRHQNLLKELQDIAAQGASERVHLSPQKKNVEDSDQVTVALEGHPGMEDTTERSAEREGVPTEGGGNEVEEEEQESQEKNGEFREGNEIGGTNEGEVAKEEEEEEQEDSEEKMAPVQEGERKEEEETHSSSGEDEEKGKVGNETEDDSRQVSKGGEAEPLRAAPEAESSEERSRQAEEEAEEAEGEEETEREPEDKRSLERGAEEESQDDATNEVKEDGEGRLGSERWSKRREESPTEPSEDVDEENPTEEKQGGPRVLWSLEDGENGERRSPEAQELRMMARGEEKEERRDEEGSASHRGEDHEIARLAAIESELESVAQRLHELRRG